MAEPAHGTEVGHEPAGGEATAFGLDAPAFIALAMLVVIAVMIWKKVPAAIGKALDAKIALIRDLLAEAEALRKEAEALKAEYQAKANSAEAEAAAMIERAHGEAAEIIAKAKSDAEGLIERRSRMAEDKIAAEERAAVKQLRAAAADSAARAAARLIAGRDDPKADEKLVDQAIAELGRPR
jgi:F-type H+-transporting ATPase subunit b